MGIFNGHEKKTIQQVIADLGEQPAREPSLKERAKEQRKEAEAQPKEAQERKDREEAGASSDPKALNALSKDVVTRELAAGNAHAPEEAQERLSKDPYAVVRLAVAGTSRSRKILERLADPKHEEDADVTREAEQSLASLASGTA